MTRKPLSILVVDDDHDNAASLGELFEMEGHAVSVAHSGEDAISAYVRENFDVAFMDVMMPGMNGVESFLEIRRLKPSAKVYMMTGYSVEELLRQAISEGALGVLEKPLDAAEVLKLSASVGAGIVLANPKIATKDTGRAIHAALEQNGIRSKLVMNEHELRRPIAADEVLVIDAHVSLMEGVSTYRFAQKSGHRAPTFLVPGLTGERNAAREILRDVAITGVLNKPFDPMDLLARLPVLAA